MPSAYVGAAIANVHVALAPGMTPDGAARDRLAPVRHQLNGVVPAVA